MKKFKDIELNGLFNKRDITKSLFKLSLFSIGFKLMSKHDVYASGSNLKKLDYDEMTVNKKINTDVTKKFIENAFEMRQQAIENNDQAFGAIVVYQGEIVGLGPSRVINNQDPTAHAEMEAIKAACKTLKTRDLSQCVLYSTSRPCRMCETAAYWANISDMFYGKEARKVSKNSNAC